MPPAVPQHLVKKAIRAWPGPPASVLTNSTVRCPEQSELGAISLAWTRHRDLPQVWPSSPSPCHRDPDTSRYRVLKLPPDRYPQPTSQGRPAHCPGYPATPPQQTHNSKAPDRSHKVPFPSPPSQPSHSVASTWPWPRPRAWSTETHWASPLSLRGPPPQGPSSFCL